jgi:hypothetical protein
VVADRGAGAARDGRWPGAGGADGIHGTRAEWERERERERERPGFRKGVNELSGKVLKTRVIY